GVAVEGLAEGVVDLGAVLPGDALALGGGRFGARLEGDDVAVLDRVRGVRVGDGPDRGLRGVGGEGGEKTAGERDRGDGADTGDRSASGVSLHCHLRVPPRQVGECGGRAPSAGGARSERPHRVTGRAKVRYMPNTDEWGP